MRDSARSGSQGKAQNSPATLEPGLAPDWLPLARLINEASEARPDALEIKLKIMLFPLGRSMPNFKKKNTVIL